MRGSRLNKCSNLLRSQGFMLGDDVNNTVDLNGTLRKLRFYEGEVEGSYIQSKKGRRRRIILDNPGINDLLDELDLTDVLDALED